MTVKVLLIEDNPDDALFMRRALRDAGPGSFQMTHVDRLSAGLELLEANHFDVLLLDLSLPDSSGAETFHRVHEHAPNVPVLVLTGLDDETLGAELVRQGGQDYLVKGHADEHLLGRSINYAIERHRIQHQLSNLATENMVMAQIGRLISSTFDIQDVYQSFAVEAAKLIAFDRIIIMIVNLEEGVAPIAYKSGAAVPGRGTGDLLPFPGSLAEAVIKRREGMIVQGGDADELMGLFPGLAPSIRAGFHSFLAVPLMAKGEVVAVMNLASTTAAAYSDRDLTLATRIGEQVAGAIANAQLYAQRVQAEEELARSNVELEQFASAASHDLQEPLRMVTSYAQILADDYKDRLDSDADRYINYVVDGASRMKVLIDDLLAYSRIGSQAAPLEPVDCNAVLQLVLGDLAGAIDDGGARVTHDPLPEVMGDGTQLAQVFQNLISNGIKFRGEALPHVHVSTKQAEGDWVFSVRDNGIGIDPRHYERIFQMFQRLHHRSQYPGTGIGLALCNKVVQRHGGRIWVESEPGSGSAFCFTIPIIEEEGARGGCGIGRTDLAESASG